MRKGREKDRQGHALNICNIYKCHMYLLVYLCGHKGLVEKLYLLYLQRGIFIQ